MLVEEKFNIDKILKEENLIEQFISNYDGISPVILYGIGAGISWYIKLLNMLDIPIACLTDSNVKIKGIYTTNGIIPSITYQVIPFELICNRKDKVYFIISAVAHREIIQDYIIKNYLGKKEVYAFDAVPVVLQNRMPSEYRRYIKNNHIRFERLWAILADEQSKITMYNCLRGGLTSNCDYYQNISSDSQYFPDIIKERMTTHEVFVDVGAYTGDSIDEFIQCVNGKYEKIIAFEPDDINFNIAQEKYQDERIVLKKQGCGSKYEKLFFQNANGDFIDAGAHVVKDKEQSTTQIEVVKLDDVINQKITYLKMDIEGMESEALKGSKMLIQKYKPKLAICVYHKKEDFLDIADYIRFLNPSYRLYLRHFWNCSGSDTVMFAVC